MGPIHHEHSQPLRALVRLISINYVLFPTCLEHAALAMPASRALIPRKVSCSKPPNLIFGSLVNYSMCVLAP